MKDWVLIMMGALIALVIAPLLLAVCTGCGPSVPAIDVASYEAQQLACIEEAGTRAEADACRNEVKRRFGRLDAGGE